ncbi:MAG: hypothetical protein GY696_23545 [Gammaproteobacteria bacterium]|nr:hypothetical protein [Gammaproteobacteria bacterium]
MVETALSIPININKQGNLAFSAKLLFQNYPRMLHVWTLSSFKHWWSSCSIVVGRGLGVSLNSTQLKKFEGPSRNDNNNPFQRGRKENIVLIFFCLCLELAQVELAFSIGGSDVT